MKIHGALLVALVGISASLSIYGADQHNLIRQTITEEEEGEEEREKAEVAAVAPRIESPSVKIMRRAREHKKRLSDEARKQKWSFSDELLLCMGHGQAAAEYFLSQERFTTNQLLAQFDWALLEKALTDKVLASDEPHQIAGVLRRVFNIQIPDDCRRYPTHYVRSYLGVILLARPVSEKVISKRSRAILERAKEILDRV